MPREITDFFERYREAFNALDGAAIADFYAEPSGIAQGGTFTHWPTRTPVRENMDALCDLYRGKGYARAEFEATSFIPQGDRHAIADLRWRIDWTSTEKAWVFSTTYNLVRSEQGWKILLCTAYQEDKLFQKASDAVGTGITPRPPHRSVRAELPHTALASGSDDQPPTA